jgi:NAD(P)-dependent dehydrogenase (short-subunit alcohol dehydrogenase family)
MSLLGKRIILTGASGGLGFKAMEYFKANGAKIIGIDKKARPSGSDPDILIADIRDEAAITIAMRTAISRLGGLDVLINNAGVLQLHDPEKGPGADVQEAIDVHIVGTWRVTSLALPELLKSGGRILNVASLFAVVNAPFIAAYTSTKRAISGYSDILRMHYRGKLQVATLYPGYMNTPIHDAAVDQGLSVAKIVTFYIGKKKLIGFEEPLSRAVKGLARACTKRTVRNRGLTAMGTLTLYLAKRMPRFIDWFVNMRINQLVKAGRLAITLKGTEATQKPEVGHSIQGSTSVATV